jgi:hypothetical protein
MNDNKNEKTKSDSQNGGQKSSGMVQKHIDEIDEPDAPHDSNARKKSDGEQQADESSFDTGKSRAASYGDSNSSEIYQTDQDLDKVGQNTTDVN